MKQKAFSLTTDQLCIISSIIEKETYAYSLESKNDSFLVYANKLGRKKLVYITSKTSFSFNQYVNEVVQDSLKLIQGKGYSDQVDVFCTNAIESPIINQTKDKVLTETGIQLCLYDLNAIKMSKNAEVVQYLNSIWNLEENKKLNLNGSKKALFDILASGKETTDIKNNLLHSIIVLNIYNDSNHASIAELKNKVISHLGKDIGNLDVVLQQMAALQIIKYDKNSHKHVSLNEETFNKVNNLSFASKKI